MDSRDPLAKYRAALAAEEEQAMDSHEMCEHDIVVGDEIVGVCGLRLGHRGACGNPRPSPTEVAIKALEEIRDRDVIGSFCRLCKHYTGKHCEVSACGIASRDIATMDARPAEPALQCSLLPDCKKTRPSGVAAHVRRAQARIRRVQGREGLPSG